jgi:diaminopimelate epimerase
MRVWERGSGETFACGTGASAVAVASYINGYTNNKITVHLLGGDLDFFYDDKADVLWMTGPATTVYDGEVDIDSI